MANKIYIPRCNGDREKLKPCNLSLEEIENAYALSKGVDDWRRLQPVCHMRKGKLVCYWMNDCSAYKLAEAWEKDNSNLPTEINALFGGAAELLVATPEHSTQLDGKGKVSRTDVLAFVCADGKLYAVAVEGKINEPFGKHNVCEWLDAGENRCNREKRLEHILDELSLSRQCVMDLRYQLLHRAASAVIEAKRFNAHRATMIVHSFSEEHKWFCEFDRFLRALKITNVKIGKLYKRPDSQNLHFPLFLGWATPFSHRNAKRKPIRCCGG